MVVIIGLVVIAGLVVVVESEYQEGVVADCLVVITVAGVVLVSGSQVQEQLGVGLLSTVTAADVEDVLVVAVVVACRRESSVTFLQQGKPRNMRTYRG